MKRFKRKQVKSNSIEWLGKSTNVQKYGVGWD